VFDIIWNWTDQPFVSVFFIGTYIVNFFISLIIIFVERKNPAATIAWIMILFLIPIGGIVLYIFLSQNIARKKIFKLTKDEEWLTTNSLEKQNADIQNGSFVYSNHVAKLWRDLIRLNQIYGRAYYTQDNQVEIIADGNQLFQRMLEDIKGAKEKINVMFFILRNDAIGKAFVDALTDKAKSGVEVRLLVDALGSRFVNHGMLNQFIQAGGKYALFFPAEIKIINRRLNYRNHRKLMIIDDAVGYVGGFNVAKEYLGMKKKFGYWRDTHLRIVGGSVQDMNYRFLQDWRFASKEQLDLSKVFFEPTKAAGATGVQIVSCGPDSDRQEIKRAFMKMITSATKNIFIQTPYFVPDQSILESLKMASQSGVDVRIMIPCMPDHMFVYWATYSFIGEMLKDGVRVYIYENGFLHAKTIAVDGEVCSVGSANFDNRSFKLNFEANAFMFDANVTKELEKVFKEDLKQCRQLTWKEYLARPISIRIKEAFSRLLSDFL
jgi:cardiolipin synthase A/B